MSTTKTDKNEKNWVLIYTKVRQEIKANDNLRREVFKTFLPLIAPSNKNSELKYLVPVFSRYLFLQINSELDNWTSIMPSNGVNHVVMFSEKFTSIPGSIINSIKDRLSDRGINKENNKKVDYQKGDLDCIEDGQFSGIDAIFLSKKSKDRVRLLLKLLNISVVAEIAKSNLANKEVAMNFKL